MSIEILRLLFDFGLLVLIWMVQLVVYPSFKFYPEKELLHWHHRYTGRITLIVMPLMLGQLILVGVQLWNEVNWYTVISILIVGVLWLSTFTHFIPLHDKISKGELGNNTLNKLVQNNWMRTLLWTLVFGISLFNLL